MTGKDVVAQNHRHGITADKVRTDDERLRQSIRAWLNGIGQVHNKLMPVTQQILKAWRILRSGNDQDVPDARIHKNRHRVIDHWLIIDGEELLACNFGERIQVGA